MVSWRVSGDGEAMKSLNENYKCCGVPIEIVNDPSDYDQLFEDFDGAYYNKKTGKEVIMFGVSGHCEICNKRYGVILPVSFVEDLIKDADENSNDKK